MDRSKEILIYNSILNSTKSIVYLYDLEKKEISFLNQGFYLQLGYEKFENDKLSFDKFLQLIHPDDQENYNSHIIAILAGREKKYTSLEYRIQSKKGEWRWYSDNIFRLTNEKSDNNELVGYATDFSSNKTKEEKFLREEIRLKAILDNTIEFYFFLDKEMKIQSLNKNAKDFLYKKINRNIFEGYSILEFLPLEDPTVFKENFLYALKGTTIQHEEVFKNEMNEINWFQFRYLPIIDKKKRITGVCFTFVDMTEIRKSNELLKELNRNLEDRVNERTKELKEEVIQRKNTESKLRVSLEKEKELNELKSKFITMVSHEFRTPMTAISMSTQILEDYGKNYSQSEKEKHYVRIKESITSLNNLMEGVLSISRDEASNIPFKPEPLNLKKFLLNMISNFESIYPKNKFLLHFHDLNEEVFSLDSNLITHILENLLNNAVKYSPNEMVIEMSVRIDENSIELIVKDFGLGIPEEDQEHIFQTFYRGKNVGNISGTGIGLNLVQNFVKLHGGRIELKSSGEFGTEFQINLPIL